MNASFAAVAVLAIALGTLPSAKATGWTAPRPALIFYIRITAVPILSPVSAMTTRRASTDIGRAILGFLRRCNSPVRNLQSELQACDSTASPTD